MRSTPTLGSHDWFHAAALVGGVALLLGVLAQVLPVAPAVAVGLALSVFLLSVPPLILALPAWLQIARAAAGGTVGRWVFGALLVAALLPERLARGTASDFVAPAVYVAAALLVSGDRPRQSTTLRRDVLLVLLLWLPLEFRWVTGERVLLKLLGLDLLLLLYVVERPVFELGRILPLRRNEVVWGTAAWAGFLLLAIPIALATGFVSPGIADRSPGEWAIVLVGVFWMTALPEEALFRGVIQSLLCGALRKRWWALTLASLIFGLAHLNNAATPDWRYVVLACFAGAAYGLAYIKTGNLAAPVLTHFLVDATWGGLFAGGPV